MEKSKAVFYGDGYNYETIPYWISSTGDTNYPKLTEDIHVDVAIVGGGMTGITSALLLKRAGLKVAVIEADSIAKATTSHTTAKITSQHNLIYDKIKNKMGEEKARQYANANESAIHMIENLIREKNIDCDFEKHPAYVYTLKDEYIKKIEAEADTASNLGIAVSFLDKIPLSFSVKAAVRFDNQAAFHPRKYILALAEEIPGDGSFIFENTRAVDIDEGEFCSVITEDGKKVVALNVIIASHYPFYDGGGLYFTRIYAEKSYALGITINEKFPDGMFITAEDPGRSLRSQKYEDGELILVSGEHHKTGHGGSTLKHYKALENFAHNTFDVKDILYRWSTQDCMTMDDVPYIGKLTSKAKNIYVATGFRKWGMTNSTAAAMILKDLIINGKSEWMDVYNPLRFNPTVSAAEFIKQNTDVAKNFISGKLANAPHNLDLKPGEAKIVEIDGKKVGAYKDPDGQLFLVDTTCTHLGCEVTWNDAEKTWDCPCHGSRFSYDGHIVEGPALKQLNRV